MASQTVTDKMSSIPTLENVLSLVWAPKPTDSFWDTLSAACKTSSVEMSLPERAIGSRRARQIAGKVEDYWQTQLRPAVDTVWCHHRAYIIKKIDRPYVIECLMMEVQPTTFKPTVVLTCGNRGLILRYQKKIKKDPTFERSGFDIITHKGALLYAMMPNSDPDAGLPSGAPPEPAGSGSSTKGRGRRIKSRDASPSRGPVHTRRRSRSLGRDDSPPQRRIVITDDPSVASLRRRRSPGRSRDDSIIILGPSNSLLHRTADEGRGTPRRVANEPNFRHGTHDRGRHLDGEIERYYRRSYAPTGPTRSREPDQPNVDFLDSQPIHPRYTQRYSGPTYGFNDTLDQGYIDSMPRSRYIQKSSFEAESPSKSPSRSSPPGGPAVIADSAKRDRLNMPEGSNSKPLPDPIPSSEFCGAPIYLYVGGDIGESEKRWATIGGVLSILGRLYYLTTAHQFLLQPPADASTRDVIDSDAEDSNYGSDSDTDNGSAPSTLASGARAMTHDLIRDTCPSFVGHSVIYRVPSLGTGPETPFARFRTWTRNRKSLVSMEEDWALLGTRLVNRKASVVNRIVVNRIEHNGTMLEVTKINSITKTTTALLIRNNGKHTQVMCSFAQALVSLPGSPRLHQVHRVDGQIRSGDSGSWVIDAETGDLLGIIVAKCGDDAGYMLLAKNVVTQIQDEMGLEQGEVGLPSGQAPSEESIQRATRFFDTPVRRAPLLSGPGPKNPGKARDSSITGEERVTEDGTKAFLDEMHLRLEALASDSTSTDMALRVRELRLRVRELRLDCDFHEVMVNRRLWSAGDSSMQLNLDKIKADVESLEAMRPE